NDQGQTWSIPLRVGFRDIKFQNNGILLNGKPVIIRGIDLRQESLVNGVAQSVEDVEADLQAIKGIGLNLVRVIGMAPHPATAQLCDELGLFLVPHSGLNGVPASLLNVESLQSHLGHTMRSLMKRDGVHPSIIAWAVGDGLSPDPLTIDALTSLQEELRPVNDRPLIAGFYTTSPINLPPGLIGILQRPPYDIFEPLPSVTPESPWLYGGIGAFNVKLSPEEEQSAGQVRQADAMLHQLKSLSEMEISGYLIDSFADRRGVMPMLFMGATSNPSRITRGLYTLDRNERIVGQKVADAFGQMRINAPAVRVESSEFPVEFPIATLIIAAILLLGRRQNNVFRQNVQRVFAHTHGFFIDIRDRRYFQIGQSIVIALLVSATLGVLLECWLFIARMNFDLDYMLTLLVPWVELKSYLVVLAWNPLFGMAILTSLALLYILGHSVVLVLLTLPSKGNLGLRQSFSMVSWGMTHFLLLLPFGLFQFRLLGYEWFRISVATLFGLFVLWFVFRYVNMVRIALRISMRLSWLLLIVVTIIVLGTIFSLYESGYALFEYFNHFRTVILPWLAG
ncbi:hypothetical protein K8I28_07155, partial [bacterium]|nr:hypothetical protein [bacterium]